MGKVGCIDFISKWYLRFNGKWGNVRRHSEMVCTKNDVCHQHSRRGVALKFLNLTNILEPYLSLMKTFPIKKVQYLASTLAVEVV